MVNQKKKIKKIAGEYKLKLVILFGSAAEGKTHSKSDIDIAVMGEDKIDGDKFLKLISEFQSIFSDHDIDLCDTKKADPLLLWNISRPSKLLYGSRNDFDEFKIYAFKRYVDFKPYFKIEETSNRRFIKESVG